MIWLLWNWRYVQVRCERKAHCSVGIWVRFCVRNRCMVAISPSGNGSIPFWSSQKTGCTGHGRKGQTFCTFYKNKFNFVIQITVISVPKLNLFCCQKFTARDFFAIYWHYDVYLLVDIDLSITMGVFAVFWCLHGLIRLSRFLCSSIFAFLWSLLMVDTAGCPSSSFSRQLCHIISLEEY